MWSWESRGGTELIYPGSGQLSPPEDSASQVSVTCSQNSFGVLFCFFALKKIENVCRRTERQLAARAHSSGARKWQESLLFFRRYLWIADRHVLAIFLLTQGGGILPFLPALLSLSVCPVDAAVGFTCAAVGEAAGFLPLRVQLGRSAGPPRGLKPPEIKRAGRFGGLSGLESSHPGSQPPALVLMWPLEAARRAFTAGVCVDLRQKIFRFQLLN